MKKRIFYCICFVWALTIVSCKEKQNHKVAIRLGDSTLIVTEQDSTFLQNYTNDIAPARKKSAAAEISKMMVQVDSMKTSQQMEEEAETASTSPLSGFTINFAECDVVFDGITAHALNASQNERALHSVSYLKDGGNFMETRLEISQLTELRVEERLFVKLGIEINGETLILSELPKYITQWYNLAGKGNRFVSVGNNSLEFNSIDVGKIRAALDLELKKKKKSKEEAAQWLNAVNKIKSYTDPPCKLVPTSAQWRIFGKKAGVGIRKLIQFDIAH